MPPLVGVAVNINALPVHVGVAPVEMVILTAGVTTGFTVIVIPLDVAVGAVVQVALVVITQVITSEVAKVVVVYVTPVAMLLPFSFH